MTASRRQRQGVFRIGAIAERFAIHPQTLRLYEREGLLRSHQEIGGRRRDMLLYATVRSARCRNTMT